MKPSRNHAAVASMLVGLAAGPTGALIQWGPGMALLVASGLLIALALILGWKSA